MKTINDKIDQFEAIMLTSHPTTEMPLKHFFLPGMYIRTILMYSEQWITSMVHNTVHPFFIRRGKVSVFSEMLGEELVEIGHMGVTTPGTRRILYIHEETEWATQHPLSFITGLENEWPEDEKVKLVAYIEDLILEKHVNPLLGGVLKNNIVTPLIETE